MKLSSSLHIAVIFGSREVSSDVRVGIQDVSNDPHADMMNDNVHSVNEQRVERRQNEDRECHPRCKTCRGNGISDLWCTSCPDGSELHTAYDFDFGFCGERCPLCFNAETPLNPGNKYRDTGNSYDETYNCTDEYLIFDGNVVPKGPSFAYGDGICAYAQTQTYLQCRCPSLPPLTSSTPPPDDICTLCTDGSEPQKPDAILNHSKYDDISWSCQLLADEFAYPDRGFWGVGVGYYQQGSYSCGAKQYPYYETCGCPKPEQHIDGCTLCYDGAPVSTEYINKSVSGSLSSGETCGDLEKVLPWQREKDNYFCREFYNKDGALYCGCVDVPTEEPTKAPTSKASRIHVEVIVLILVAMGLQYVL